MDWIELVQEIRTNLGTETDIAKIKQIDFFTRLVVVPRAVGAAFIPVVAPISWETLNDILTKTGLSSNNPLIPTVRLKASQTG